MEMAKDEDHVLQLGKEEREKQKWAQDKGIWVGPFLFRQSRHHR
jgi:hypothetical protein